MILPVILAGGSGSRLWPLSRELHPKQFLDLTNNKHSILQESLLRIPQDHQDMLPGLIICQAEHRFLLAEQLRNINYAATGIILEPMLRNTALAISVAALWAKQNLSKTTEDPILLIMPADHIIAEPQRFAQAIIDGATLAAAGKLVTLDQSQVILKLVTAISNQAQLLAIAMVFRIAEFIENQI